MVKWLLLVLMLSPVLVFLVIISALLVKCARQIRRSQQQEQQQGQQNVHNFQLSPNPNQIVNQVVVRSVNGPPGGSKIIFMPNGQLMFAQPSKSSELDCKIMRERSTVLIYNTEPITPETSELPEKSGTTTETV
eukprot:TRINITY_DN416_c0_g2_i1.p1 TRINITY_DN416_c0_g2~~TRINITY_DN416_c0_g2_i1.p1  ORF type:complete len:134 (-),score=9.20 TRINITY_DN416_c0_g2_i1:261-662(-)